MIESSLFDSSTTTSEETELQWEEDVPDEKGKEQQRKQNEFKKFNQSQTICLRDHVDDETSRGMNAIHRHVARTQVMQWGLHWDVFDSFLRPKLTIAQRVDEWIKLLQTELSISWWFLWCLIVKRPGFTPQESRSILKECDLIIRHSIEMCQKRSTIPVSLDIVPSQTVLRELKRYESMIKQHFHVIDIFDQPRPTAIKQRQADWTMKTLDIETVQLSSLDREVGEINLKMATEMDWRTVKEDRRIDLQRFMFVFHMEQDLEFELEFKSTVPVIDPPSFLNRSFKRIEFLSAPVSTEKKKRRDEEKDSGTTYQNQSSDFTKMTSTHSSSSIRLFEQIRREVIVPPERRKKTTPSQPPPPPTSVLKRKLDRNSLFRQRKKTVFLGNNNDQKTKDH
jgi:hypothetical protein